MKCQILLSGQNKKYIINMSVAELTQRMLKSKSQKTGFDISCKLSPVEIA